MPSFINYHPHRILECGDGSVGINDEHVSTSIAVLLLALAASEVLILLLCKAMAWYADVVFYSQDWTAKASLEKSPEAIAKSLCTSHYERPRLVSDEETTCPICLVEFGKNATKYKMPLSVCKVLMLTLHYILICFLETNDSVSHGKASCQKHTFHTQCISQWLAKQSTCPCCRQEILEPESTASPLWQQVESGLDPSFCLFVF